MSIAQSELDDLKVTQITVAIATDVDTFDDDVVAGPATLHRVQVNNNGSGTPTNVFVKFYDALSVAAYATDDPVEVYEIVGGASADNAGSFAVNFPNGLKFETGISIAVSKDPNQNLTANGVDTEIKITLEIT